MKKDLRDVENLEGQDFLDALTHAQNKGLWKGWTFTELVHGPSVLPTTVYDETNPYRPIVEHVCVVTTGHTRGSITSLTLMITTPEGTTYQDFVPRGRGP